MSGGAPRSRAIPHHCEGRRRLVGLTERARPGVVGPLNAGTRAIVIVREESRRVEPTRRLDLRRVRCLGPKAFARWFGVRKIVRGGSNRFSSISLPSTKGPPTPRTAYACCARQGNPALINQVVQARQEVSGFLHLIIRRSSACRDGRHLLAFQCRWRLTNVERRHCAELSLLRRPSATDGSRATHVYIRRTVPCRSHAPLASLFPWSSRRSK